MGTAVTVCITIIVLVLAGLLWWLFTGLKEGPRDDNDSFDEKL